MARYHVSGDGQPRVCTASSPESCPRAQRDENGKIINHFDSESDADRYGEKIVAAGAKNAGSLSKNPLDAMAKHAPDDAPDDPAVRTALGALAMRGCTLEKREDGRYEITGVDNNAMIGLVSDRGTFVNGAEVNDDGSVGIGITMNGSIPHWGTEGGHASWGGGDVSLEAHGDLLLKKNEDGEYELVPDNDEDITSRISFDPRETVEDFKYGVNDLDIDEDNDDGWVDANAEAIRENLSGLSDVDCDYYFGAGTSNWIQEDGAGELIQEDGAGEERELEKLSTSSDEHVRRHVAMNPDAPADVLAKMSTDSDDRVRRCVAENPSTPADVLDKLSTDSDADVRHHVAGNPRTPVDMLVRMSDDPDEYVRSSVAKNPSTPTDVLVRMSADSSADVRHCVAGKPRTPADVLDKLSTDSDASVRRAVAENPNTPASALARMSDDPDSQTRSLVATKPRTPADVLVRMSADSAIYVRRDVANNANTPVDALVRMSTDSDETVRRAVANNPNTPADALTRMSTDSVEFVRRNVAWNPNTPPDSLIKLSTDSDSDVRYGVAYNPNTPLNVLTKLVHDKDSYVRRKALENLETRR